MAKKKYTREEALKEFFDNLHHSNYQGDTPLYNSLQAYKVRYKRGDLGDKSAIRVLTEYAGFEHKEHFLKKGKG